MLKKGQLSPGSSPLVWFVLVGLFVATAAFGQKVEREVLARVNVTDPVRALDLPIHAWLQDGQGQDYLLVIAAEPILAKSGVGYQILAQDARAEEYVLAAPKRAGARAAAMKRHSVLQDDGRRLLIRATDPEAEELAEMGFAIQRLSGTPLFWQPPVGAGGSSSVSKSDFIPDARVQALVNQVSQAELLTLLRQVTGEEAALVGGSPYTITTRHTSSGTPIQKATQFAYERMEAAGLQVSYHNWTSSTYANRNVVGTLPGNTRSNEIVLMTAHLDNLPTGARAPGADDNASGSVALLTAAKFFSEFRFERTIRFIFFTGEEQGLRGSSQYASAAQTAGDNIVGVFNMDMLGWNGTGGPELRLHTRTTTTPGYSNDLFIATIFTNVVGSYGLSSSLTPVITPDADNASDHASFWNRGYVALYVEEDYPGDFNPYYHTTADTVAGINMAYYAAYTRAALGTVAHLAHLNQAPLFLAAGPLATNGTFWVRYGGAPGLDYTIQIAPAASGEWTFRTNMPAGADGFFDFAEPMEPVATRFFRAVWP